MVSQLESQADMNVLIEKLNIFGWNMRRGWQSTTLPELALDYWDVEYIPVYYRVLTAAEQ